MQVKRNNKIGDSIPLPPIEIHEGIYVVQEYKVMPYGSKVRFLEELIKTTPHKEIVFGSSPRWGFAQQSISYLCQKYNKKFTLFIAKGQLHEYTKIAEKLGANIIQVPMGFLAVTEKRARDYTFQDPENRLLFPIGVEHPSVIESIKNTGKKLSEETGIVPDHVWTASSSGTLHRGLALAWPKAEIHAVSVGHKMDERQKGTAIVHETKYKFQQIPKKAELPPFPCALHYEAKLWPVMKEYYHDYWNDFGELKVLMWNVGM